MSYDAYSGTVKPLNYGRCKELMAKLHPLIHEDADIAGMNCCTSCHDEMDDGYEACEFELEGETFQDVCCTVATFADGVVHP